MVESLGFGGAEQNLLSVLRALPADRFEHHLAWLYDDERLLEAFRPHLASLLPLKAQGPLGLLRGAGRLAAWLRQRRPDVVHTQLVRAQLVGRTAALLAGRMPVVTTWQNVFYDDRALADFRSSRLLRSLVRGLDRVTGRIDRHFIAVSEHVAAEQSRSLGVDRSRVSVIFNSIGQDRYQAVAADHLAKLRGELGLSRDAKILLAVGRLVEQKGHRGLIACMPAVLAQSPNAVLIIAGRGPLADELGGLVRSLGLEGRVHLLGSRSDVPALYQIADLFVFPSKYEGLSVALVEALANGLPAVVSDLPQNREVAEGIPSVTFVGSGDPMAWARAITGALRGPTVTPVSDRDRLRRCFSSQLLSPLVGDALARAAGWTTAAAR